MSISSTTDRGPANHKLAMDRMYRLQRHFYDATRAYYLLGRDQMINQLNAPKDGSILEIGCGTGRNLLRVSDLYPGRQLYGIDISDEMLKSARSSLARHGRSDAQLAQADATALDQNGVLGQAQFDRVYFSYTLSMIPDWRKALHQAALLVAPGGELHVVDFGSCAGLPNVVKVALYNWLKAFHVFPRQDLELVANTIANGTGMSSTVGHSHRGYAVHLRMVRPHD